MHHLMSWTSVHVFSKLTPPLPPDLVAGGQGGLTVVVATLVDARDLGWCISLSVRPPDVAPRFTLNIKIGGARGVSTLETHEQKSNASSGAYLRPPPALLHL